MDRIEAIDCRQTDINVMDLVNGIKIQYSNLKKEMHWMRRVKKVL